MWRILIVDDEEPVASGLAHIIKRDFSSEFEVAALAASGKEALEKAGQLFPDIILMDVRMPGFSGMDAIRELKKRGSTAVFIVITAYERFEIVREAIELGVVDYLLKPVSSHALALSLHVAAAHLRLKSESERDKLALNEAVENARVFAEKALLFGLMAGAGQEEDLSLYKKLLGLQGETMMLAALEISGKIADRASAHGELYRELGKTIKYKTDFLISPPIENVCLILIPLKEPEAASEAASEAAEKLESLLASIPEALSRKISPQTGYSAVHSYAEGPQAWNEALGALYLRRQKHAAGPAQPQLLGERLQKALAEGAERDIRFLLDEYLSEKSPAAPVHPADICSLIALVGSALRKLKKDGHIGAEEEAALFAMEDLYAASNTDSFVSAAKTRLSRLGALLRETAPRHAPAVAAAMAYVRKNYAAPINLDRAAKEIGISPGRLSRLFVAETGKGFSHYLIRYRVAKAKELLAKPGASIKEVSAASGYPDQNYFARLFKKVTGRRPSSFIPTGAEAQDES